MVKHVKFSNSSLMKIITSDGKEVFVAVRTKKKDGGKDLMPKKKKKPTAKPPKAKQLTPAQVVRAYLQSQGKGTRLSKK